MKLRDLQLVIQFVSETAFYVDELERERGEDMVDFWAVRERALKILTGWAMEASDEEVTA